MDSVQNDLIGISLDLCASAGLLAEIVKKWSFHGHALDQRQLRAVLDRVENDWLLAEAWLESASRKIETAG